MDNIEHDVRFKKDGFIFSFRVGGILVKDDKILLTKHKHIYTIPGGHVKLGEKSYETVLREFYEETNLKVKVKNVIATFENFWIWDDVPCHQILIYYRLELDDELGNSNFNPDTEGTQFVFVPIKEVPNLELYPVKIKELIMEDAIDDKHFTSQN